MVLKLSMQQKTRGSYRKTDTGTQKPEFRSRGVIPMAYLFDRFLGDVDAAYL